MRLRTANRKRERAERRRVALSSLHEYYKRCVRLARVGKLERTQNSKFAQRQKRMQKERVRGFSLRNSA